MGLRDRVAEGVGEGRQVRVVAQVGDLAVAGLEHQEVGQDERACCGGWRRDSPEGTVEPEGRADAGPAAVMGGRGERVR